MIQPFAAAALLALLPMSALADQTVSVSQPWARASIIASRPGAAYLTLESRTGDRLTGASTPAADELMIHAAEEANGVSRMVHLPALDLPAGEPVTLAPGGMHLMLVGLAAKLEEGASFPMTLRFERAPDLTIKVPVLGIAARGPEDMSQ
ncbi:MAG TPA: copper chaperone PCu(A)C [Paracoccaceae bacterium]|nr:copper chaperone PCu(A)C [Paracoccaceae bacterium]